MSHMKVLQANIKDLELLGRVAKKLGCNLVVGKKTIKDYYGVDKKVDAKLDLKDKNGRECIGFEYNKEEHSYAMIGDTYNMGSQDILKKIQISYAEELVNKEALEDGFTQICRVEKNGEIYITLEN